jgi:hypothetical protein
LWRGCFFLFFRVHRHWARCSSGVAEWAFPVSRMAWASYLSEYTGCPTHACTTIRQHK